MIHFLIKYNEKIIYVLGGAICFLSAVVVWWQVFGKKGLRKENMVEVDLSGIEESLKKILSQTNTAIGSAGATAEAGGGAVAAAGAAATAAGVPLTGLVGSDGKPLADAGAVKSELEKRAKIIEELRAEVKTAKEQDSSPDLLAKIKGLEGRLAEYEIIEDDIADLSVLKEENAKLKKEIENMKRGGPQMVDQFAEAVAQAEGQPAATAPAEAVSAVQAPEASPAPAAVAPTPEPAPAAAPASTAQASSPPPPSPVMQGSIGGADAMAAAVAAAQEKLDTASPPPDGQVVIGADAAVVASTAAPDAAAAAPEVTSPVAASAAAQPAVEAPKGDIFAEFSSDADASDPLAALGEIDPDKMLDELKDLNMESSVGAEALEQAPDIDKMAQEAAALDDKKG